MDDNQSLTMATYTKLCGILPYLQYFQWQSTRLPIECPNADICTSCLAVPSTIPTTIQETKSSAIWQKLQCRLQCQIQWRLQYGIQCHTCFEVTLPSILPNNIPTVTQRSRDTQLQWPLTTANRCSLRSHMRLVSGGATTFKRGGWLYQKLKQPLQQTITVPEVQEQCTIRSIHQLRRLSAASAPGHESTSGLREQW